MLWKYIQKTKNQTKNHSVLAKTYEVYIICTSKCDAFGNSFFPLLSIIECYKPNRWRMFYFLDPPLHSTCITFASFDYLKNVLQIINQFRLVLPFRWSRHWYCPFPALMVLNKVFCDNNLVIKERQFVRMLHVINEVTIDTCDIHQIKENAEVKSNRWLSIQTICGSKLVHKINSTHPVIAKLDKFRARNWRLCLWTLFSPLNW